MKEIIEEIKKKFEHANSIVLFGSYARGNQKRTSDIDILVITDKKEDYREFMHRMFDKYGIIVSLFIISKEEFFRLINEGNSQLLSIFLEGKIIKDDGTFKRGKNLFKVLWGKENIIVKYGGKTWSTKMLDTA